LPKLPPPKIRKEEHIIADIDKNISEPVVINSSNKKHIIELNQDDEIHKKQKIEESPLDKIIVDDSTTVDSDTDLENKTKQQNNNIIYQDPKKPEIKLTELFNINAFTLKDRLMLRSNLVKAGLAIEKCVLCMKPDIISVLVPCGHISLCGVCDKTYSSILLTLCPICLQKPERKISWASQTNKATL